MSDCEYDDDGVPYSVTVWESDWRRKIGVAFLVLDFFVFPSLCVSYCVKKLLCISYSVSKKNKIRKSRYNTLSLFMTRHYRLCPFLLFHLRLFKLKQVNAAQQEREKKSEQSNWKVLNFYFLRFLHRLLLGCCKYGFMYYFPGVNWLCEIWTRRKRKGKKEMKNDFLFLLL